jgi:signal transduction histidine kinase
MQNIKAELEAKELDAWRKLIRIQRHEIINSLTPITTLTTAIKRRFTRGDKRKKLQEITDEHVDDILKSIDVIEERSRGLIEFMERFKGLTDIPGIRTDSFRLNRIITDLAVLFSREINASGIRFITEVVPADMMIRGDEKLLTQVMINLVKNSIEAIRRPGGHIRIRAFINSLNQRVIQVMDNGSGIDESALEIIFVPSYTTKEQGSGIGLSITRQIVQLHKGTIHVRSVPESETVFEITLPE